MHVVCGGHDVGLSSIRLLGELEEDSSLYIQYAANSDVRRQQNSSLCLVDCASRNRRGLCHLVENESMTWNHKRQTRKNSRLGAYLDHEYVVIVKSSARMRCDAMVRGEEMGA